MLGAVKSLFRSNEAKVAAATQVCTEALEASLQLPKPSFADLSKIYDSKNASQPPALGRYEPEYAFAGWSTTPNGLSMDSTGALGAYAVMGQAIQDANLAMARATMDSWAITSRAAFAPNAYSMAWGSPNVRW